MVEASLAGHVGTVVNDRSPHNFLAILQIQPLATAVEELDGDDCCRAILLASESHSFSAVADFGTLSEGDGSRIDSGLFYAQALRLFRRRKPIVAAVQGAAIGPGAAIALTCDFRIAGPPAKFSFDFTQLGIDPQ